MRYKQLIYTSYKKYNAEQEGLSSGYDVFSKTDGISEDEQNELISLFTNYAVPNDPRLDDLSHIEENVEKYAPKQLAYLKLSTGRYCWCKVTLQPYDFSGRYNSVYFHAVLSDEEPTFAPADFFENFSFRTKLTDDEFHARVRPPVLNVESLDESLMQKCVPSVKFSKEVLNKLLSFVLYSIRENKPLFINCNTDEAYETITTVLCLLPLSIAKKAYFSTYSSDEQTEGKAFRICHMGKDFGYYNRLSNSYVAVADLVNGKFSAHIPCDPFIDRLTDYIYGSAADCDRLKAFFESYTGGNLNFNSQALVNAYDFIYTENYKKFPLGTMLTVVDDKYISTVSARMRSERYDDYLLANPLCVRDRGLILVEIYKCLGAHSVLLNYTAELLEEVVKGALPLSEAEKMLSGIFSHDLKEVVAGDLSFFQNFISANISHNAIFDLVLERVLSLEKTDKSRADALYITAYNALSQQGDLSVLTDKFLISLKSSPNYFSRCAKQIFTSRCTNAEAALFWLDFCNKAADSAVRDIFLNLTLDYLLGGGVLNNAVKGGLSERLIELLKQPNGKNLCKDKIFTFVSKLLNITLSSSPSIDTTVNILEFYDVLTFSDMPLLYDEIEKTAPEMTLGVFVKLAKRHGVEFIISLSKGSYAKRGEAVLKRMISTPDDALTIYFKSFYAKGVYRSIVKDVLSSIEFNDETQKWLYYGKYLNEVKSFGGDIVTQLYTHLNYALFEISHDDRAAVKKVVDTIYGVSNIKPSAEIKLVKDLCEFDGNFKRALELEEYAFNLCKDEKVRSGVAAYYYDVLVNISLTVIKKRKNSLLTGIIYFEPLDKAQTEKVWKKFFFKDKNAQFAYMLELLRTDASANNADFKCSLLEYYYANTDKKLLDKFEKIVSKQKDATMLAALKKYAK